MKEENQNSKECEMTEDQIDFRALLFKYIIHWPWFVGAVLLCLVGAWFYLHWATPVYNISATVLIKDEKKGGGAGLSSELEDMEEERKINENTGNMLKQALERRQTERLSSNFSYRMMERVHQEAEKQTKRKTRVGWAALLISALALVGLGVYVLTFYLEFNFVDVMPQMNVRQDSSLFGFYVYIALLALVLLGLDYWLRKKYIWK